MSFISYAYNCLTGSEVKIANNMPNASYQVFIDVSTIVEMTHFSFKLKEKLILIRKMLYVNDSKSSTMEQTLMLFNSTLMDPQIRSNKYYKLNDLIHQVSFIDSIFVESNLNSFMTFYTY